MQFNKKQLRHHLTEMIRCLNNTHKGENLAALEVLSDGDKLYFGETFKIDEKIMYRDTIPTVVYGELMMQSAQYADEYIIKAAYDLANELIKNKAWDFCECLDNPIEIEDYKI
jgi:hypothetical protein